MQDTETSEVHRDASDISAAPVDSADASEAAEKLVKDVPAHLKSFVDFDIDQNAVDEQVSVGAADEQRRLPTNEFSL